MEATGEKEETTASAEIQHVCSSPGCNKPAVLACPSCLKLGLPPSRFCGQECFKENWSEHKAMHKDVKKARISVKTDPSTVPSEFRGFAFTGNLRPAQLSETRIVPEGIMRPDYADHPMGLPLSENEDKRKGSPMTVINFQSPRFVQTCFMIQYKTQPNALFHGILSLLQIYSKEEIAGIREACRIGREVLDAGGDIAISNRKRSVSFLIICRALPFQTHN
jgi:methionyl aminopeptidase